MLVFIKISCVLSYSRIKKIDLKINTQIENKHDFHDIFTTVLKKPKHVKKNSMKVNKACYKIYFIKKNLSIS